MKTSNISKTHKNDTKVNSEISQELRQKKDEARLIDYYRLKLESFEKERREYLEKLENLNLSHEEQHKLEWENKKRADEIMELQNVLGQTNEVLNKERRQMLAYQFELEHKDHRTKEDRRRLMDLLKLAEPIEQTISLYHDKRPDIKEKFSIHDNQLSAGKIKQIGQQQSATYNSNSTTKDKFIKSPISNSSKETSFTNKRKSLSKGKYSSGSSNKLEYRIAPMDEKQQIVRTIVMPKEEQSLLHQEIEYLKKQLSQTRQFYEDQLNKKEESRLLKDEETRLTLLAASDRIEDLMKRNHKLEKMNYELTKDYMHLKYDASQNERRLYEELELQKLQNEALSTSLKEVSSKASIDKELTKNNLERKAREISFSLRTQLKVYEEQNALIKEQYAQVQKIYTQKLGDLEGKLKVKTQKYKLLENKRNNELEGFLNEMASIRKRMKSYEDYIYKLKLYTNGDIDKSGLIQSDLRQNEADFRRGADKLKNQMNNLSKRIVGQDSLGHSQSEPYRKTQQNDEDDDQKEDSKNEEHNESAEGEYEEDEEY